MGSIDEIVLIRKALEKLIESPEDIPTVAPNHIEDLGKMKMSLKYLQKSKIGFTLNSLRKATTDENVKKSAKTLIKKWQGLEDSNPKKVEEKVASKPATSEISVDFEISAAIPTRNSKNQLVFPDYPDFKPNLTPKEVLQKGSFGGTYFRPIYSSVTKMKYGKEVWQELPKSWLEGLDIRTQVSSSIYDTTRNKYKVMWSQFRGVGKLRVDAQAGSLWVVPMVLQVLPGKKN